jgi:hypothetical protein
MTVARSFGDVLGEHVVVGIECIDRMYVNVYVPGLQYAAGLVAHVHRQLGLPIASTAPLPRSPTRSVLRCTGSPASALFRGSTSPRDNAKTT